MVLPTHIVAAGGVVENDQGEILLVKTHNAGWVFPGGIVENGENVIDAVIREIKEESGVNATVKQLFAISSNTASHKGHSGVEIVPTKVMMDFICTYINGDIGISEENSETQWFKKENVLEMISSPVYRLRYQAYVDYKGVVQYFEYVSRPEYILKTNREI